MNRLIKIKRIALVAILVPVIGLYALSNNFKKRDILALKWGNSVNEIGLERLGINAIGPRCFFADANENIYILDNGNNRISVFYAIRKKVDNISFEKIKDEYDAKFTDITVDDSGYVYLLGYSNSMDNSSFLLLIIFKQGQIIKKQVIKYDIFKNVSEDIHDPSNFIIYLMNGAEKLFVKNKRVWLDTGDYTYYLANTPYLKNNKGQFTLTRIVPHKKYFKSYITNSRQLRIILKEKFGTDWDYVGKYRDLYIINTLNDTIVIVDSKGVVKKKIALNLKIKYYEGNYIKYVSDKFLYFMENDDNGIKISSVSVVDLLGN